jgi:hypothetical protein
MICLTRQRPELASAQIESTPAMLRVDGQYRPPTDVSAKEHAMDADRFDALVRSLSPVRSRRAVLSLAAGAVATLGLADSPVRAAHHRKKTCPPGQKKCKKKCCKSGEVCANGKCVTGQGACATGSDSCAGTGTTFCKDASGQHTCLCFARLQGGTRCGILSGARSACDQCLNDDDCRALGFPRGSSCVQDFGTQCPLCDNNTLGQCILPCGAQDPT